MCPLDRDSMKDERKEPPLLMQGQILRVKSGYNPNSSSIGSGIPKFLFFSIASGAATVALLHLKSAVTSMIRKQKQIGGITPRGQPE